MLSSCPDCHASHVGLGPSTSVVIKAGSRVSEDESVNDCFR